MNDRDLFAVEQYMRDWMTSLNLHQYLFWTIVFFSVIMFVIFLMAAYWALDASDETSLPQESIEPKSPDLHAPEVKQAS